MADEQSSDSGNKPSGSDEHPQSKPSQDEPAPESDNRSDTGSDTSKPTNNGAGNNGSTRGTTSAPDAPWSEARAKRPLCRSSTDRVIAGVAGGLGTYFGVDPVIVRIVFVVLTFVGGAGPLLYLIGWLALPRDNSSSVISNALGGSSDSRLRLRNLVAVVLICFGLFLTASLSNELFDVFIDMWSIAPFLALALIAAGVVLILWPGPPGRVKRMPARPSPSPADVATVPTPPRAAGPEWAAAEPGESQTSAMSSPTSQPLSSPPSAPLPPSSPPLPPSPLSPPPSPSPASPVRQRTEPRRRVRTTIGYVTFAALLVFTGGAVILHRLGAVDIDVGVLVAALLAVTGSGLVVSAFSVPARGLVGLGVLLAAPLLLFASEVLPWASGLGDYQAKVSETRDLQDDYRHGLGTMVVDLRDLEPDDMPSLMTSVKLSLTVGEMLVYVPGSIKTISDINVRAGNLTVDSGGPGWSRSGVSLAHSRTTSEQAGPHVLRLDIDVGIGRAEVVAVHDPVAKRSAIGALNHD